MCFKRRPYNLYITTSCVCCLALITEIQLNCNFCAHAVATIGMEMSFMVQDENSASCSVCVLLIDSMQIEVPTLTALIGTQAITATG